MKSNAIPSFSFKGAFIILLAAILGGIILPFAISSMGFDAKLINVIGLAGSISFATAFVQCFIESDKGFGKSFAKTFVLFFVFTAFIAYFWIYHSLYM